MAKETLQSLRRSQSGSVAVGLALMLVPLMGVVGFTMDYANVNRLRSKLLASRDSALVATAQSFINGTPASELQPLARKLVLANLGDEYANDLQVKFTVPEDIFASGSEIRLDAKLAYHSLFSPLLGMVAGGESSYFTYFIEPAG